MAWSNFLALGRLESRESYYEPHVILCLDARSFADKLLGEVIAFRSPDLMKLAVLRRKRGPS